MISLRLYHTHSTRQKNRKLFCHRFASTFIEAKVYTSRLP